MIQLEIIYKTKAKNGFKSEPLSKQIRRQASLLTTKLTAQDRSHTLRHRIRCSAPDAATSLHGMEQDILHSGLCGGERHATLVSLWVASHKKQTSPVEKRTIVEKLHAQKLAREAPRVRWMDSTEDTPNDARYRWGAKSCKKKATQMQTTRSLTPLLPCLLYRVNLRHFSHVHHPQTLNPHYSPSHSHYSPTPRQPRAGRQRPSRPPSTY